MIMILIQTLPFALVFFLATAFTAGLVWCVCTAIANIKYLKLESNRALNQSLIGEEYIQ